MDSVRSSIGSLPLAPAAGPIISRLPAGASLHQRIMVPRGIRGVGSNIRAMGKHKDHHRAQAGDNDTHRAISSKASSPRFQANKSATPGSIVPVMSQPPSRSVSDGVRVPGHLHGGCSVTRPRSCCVTRPRAWSRASIRNRFRKLAGWADAERQSQPRRLEAVAHPRGGF